MKLKSFISSQRRGLYSRLAQASVALLLLGFSLFGLILQVVPASAASILLTKKPCIGICKTPSPLPTHTPTLPPSPTLFPSPTLSPTPTSKPSPTPSPTKTATTGTTPGTTSTPGITPTNSLTPVGPGTPTPLPGTPVPGQTPTSQSTQTPGNGTLPGSGGDNGNTPGGGSMGGLFTAAAVVLGTLAFLLYLVPQRGTSLSVLNKILALILPVSFLRRDP